MRRAAGFLLLLLLVSGPALAACAPPAAGSPDALAPPSLQGEPLAPFPAWRSGPPEPTPPGALPPREFPALPALPASVSLAGESLSYAIVARSGDVERVVAGDPLLPRAVSLEPQAATRSGGLPLFAPDGDVLVSATGLGGVPIFEPSFRFTVERLRADPLPLELWLVRPLPTGGLAYAGLSTDALPDLVTVDVSGRLDNGLTLRVATRGAASPLTLEAGRTLVDPVGFQVALAEPPTVGRLSISPGEAATQVAWTLSSSTGLGAHVSDAHRAFKAQWADAPHEGSLRLAAAGNRGSLSYEAARAGGALFISSGNADRSLSLHATDVPARWTLEVDDGELLHAEYAASAPVRALAFALGNPGKALHWDARAVPLRFSAAYAPESGLHLRADDAFGDLRLFAGALSECPAAPEPFLSLHRGPGGDCAGFHLPGVRALDVSREAGGFQLRTRLTEAVPVAARYANAHEESRLDLRLDALPAHFEAAFSVNEGSVRVRATGAENARLEAVSHRGPPGTIHVLPPGAGVSMRANGEASATALRIPSLPGALDLEMTTSREGGTSAGVRGLDLSFASLGPELEATLTMEGDDALASSIRWSAPGAAGPLESVLRGEEGAWLNARAGAFPAAGTLRFEEGRLQFQLAGNPSLEITAVKPQGVAGKVVLPACLFDRGLALSRGPGGEGLQLRLPHAPDGGSVSWSDGALGILYEGLPDPGPFEAHVHEEGRRIEGRLRLPRDADVTFSQTGRGVSLRVDGSESSSPVEVRIADATGDGFASLGHAPRAFDLEVTSTPELRYEASAAGATLALGGTGDFFGLGNGGTFSLEDAPRSLTLAPEGDGYRLGASEPVRATLELGAKRWGDALWGFTTGATKVRLDGAKDVYVEPGILSTKVQGDEGTLEVEHTPTSPANEIYIVANGPDGVEAGWNRVSLPLGHIEATTLWHSLNPLLAFHVSPLLAFGAAGGFLGWLVRLFLFRSWRGKASSPADA